MSTQELKKLENSSRDGDFVLANQELAKKEGFKNVSKIWYKQTISYEDGLAKLDEGRAATEDFKLTLCQFVPSVNASGQFVLRHDDGREFRPTEHAVNQMATWAKVGTWLPNKLINGLDEPKNKYAVDKFDAETAVRIFQNAFRRMDQFKSYLWRTRKDGTLRAMLSGERYAIVDNRWFIETLSCLIPGGRLSHWDKCDGADTIWGNVLIPDTIREESDSDYGGMLGVGNSEIGVRQLSSMPSLFRAICQNGTVWGAEHGIAYSRVHRGKIVYNELFEELKVNINKQIPLLPSVVDNMLALRLMQYDGDSILPIIAQICNELKLTKANARKLRDNYDMEGEAKHTAFAVNNMITRGSQLMTPTEWIRLNTYAGTFMMGGQNYWDRLVGKANTLSNKEVDEVFALAA